MKALKRQSITFLLMVSFFTLSAQTIKINIKNIKTQKGQLCIAFFDSQTNFKAQKPFRELICSKSDVVDKEFTITIPCDPGRMGIAVLDDENSNSKMEYNILGIPREGFGFSDFYPKGFKMPAFDNFAFDIKKGENKEFTIKMKYIL